MTVTSTTEASVKSCCTCGHRQPLDQFRRFARKKDGLDPQCRLCWAVAYRQGPGAITPPVPGDPAPAVALREELAAARQAGVSFSDAWPPAVAAALATSSQRERESWEKALASTRGAWEDGYLRREPQAGHQAVAMLAEAA